MKIAILGAGAFGTALGGVLADKGYDIDYYDPKLGHESLANVLAGAEYIVLCVPSGAAPHLLPHLPKDKPMIVATKGILSAETFADFSDYMVMSGPGFADDIKAAKNTKLTATDRRVVDLFTTDYLTFDFTDDKNGVLMCGALKNVYAIMAGLMRLEPGTSAHEKYLKAVLSEMKMILAANSAKADTVDLVCGQGDLRITCADPSRNYEFGRTLSQNPEAQPEKTVEGVSALKRIKHGEIIVPEDAIILRELMMESDVWA